MKKIRYIKLTLLCFVGLFSSCFSDQGSYDYSWMDEVHIVFDDPQSSITAGENLRVEPMVFVTKTEDYQTNSDVGISIGENQGYSFRWEAWNDHRMLELLSEEMILDVPINLPVKGGTQYYIFLKVTHDATGVEWSNSFFLKVNNGFSRGFAYVYDDENGDAEMDFFGKNSEGEWIVWKNILSGTEFDRGGGAVMTYYENRPKATGKENRVWVSSGNMTGFITLNNFEWSPSQTFAAQCLTTTDPGYIITYIHPTHHEVRFYFGEDGEMYPCNTFDHIMSGLNTIFGSVSPLPNGGVQRINFSKYIIPNGILNTLFWDETNKRMLTASVSSSTQVMPTLSVESPEYRFDGYDLIFMGASAYNSLGFDGGSGKAAVAIFKSPEGKFLFTPYGYEGRAFYPDFTNQIEMTNAAGLVDKAEFHILASTADYTNVYYYFSVGNKIYVFRYGEGCVEANILNPNNLPFALGQEEIVTMKRQTYGGYQDRIILVTYNASSDESKIYILSWDDTESKNLKLTESYGGFPRIKDITYFAN